MNEEIILRDGIPLEKGVVLTIDYLNKNKELFTKYLNLWLLSPDLLLDEIQSSEDKKHWSLKPYQRIEKQFHYLAINSCKDA